MKDINLLLEEEKVQQAEEKGKSAGGKAKMVAAAVTTLVIIGATIVLPIMYSQTLKIKLSAIQSKLESEKYQEIKTLNAQIAESMQSVNAKQEVIDAIDRQYRSVSEILDIMKNAVPEGCTIKDMDFDTKTIRVTLEAANTMQVAEFLLNTGRLEFITLADSSNSISMGKSKEYSFVFNIAGGEGNRDVNG